MLPRCQYGGESEKFSDRKPTIVVNDVIETGRKLIRTASTSASVLPSPSRISPRKESSMWIESATASVRMTTGADIAIGVSLTPAKPAAPMPTSVDNMMTTSVEVVAVKERI